MTYLHRLTVALFLMSAGWSPAQDKPVGQVPGELFFTIKNKQPFGLDRLYPGITAALMLTDEQKLTLYQSLDQTINADDLRKALEAVKSNPNATQEDKEKAARLMDAAREKLREAVKTVLKPEQQKTVQLIQMAFDASQKVALEHYKPEFAAAKGDQAKSEQVRQAWQERVRVELGDRLGKILSPEQKAALDKAAAEQKTREEAESKSKQN